MDLFDVVVAKKLSGGGGNPNRAQTVTGTLANPWGTVGFYQSLAPAVLSGNASAKMTITMPGLGSVTMPVLAESGGSAGAQLCLKSLYSYTHSAEDGLAAFGLVFARWLGSDYPSNPGPGALNVSLNVQGSSGSYTQTDVISMASSITTSLEVIWHPLP